ncbi:MAG: amino acid permease [Bacteroidales bacterium]
MSQEISSKGLIRKLGFFPVVAIIIADMVGTGIFTTSGLLMENLRNPVVMISLWAVGGFIALSGAVCYAELSTAMPHSGGEYLYLSKLFHPIVGFLSGWISFIVGFSAPVAATSIAVGEYMIEAFPAIQEFGNIGPFSGAAVFQKFLAIIVILFFAAIHLRGVELGTKVHNGFTLLKIMLIVGIIILGFSFGKGDMNNFSVLQDTDTNSVGLKAIGLSVMWIMFAYSGWNAASYIGSEVKNPAKTLPRSLLAGTLIVIIIYVLLNILFVYAIPPKDMEGLISVGGRAATQLFSSSFGQIFSVLVAIGLLSTISSLIILGPRIYYAMAKEGHFFPFAAKIHSKTGVPHWSIGIQVIVAIIIVLTGTFDDILTYMGFSLGIFPILAVFGIFKLRKQKLKSYKVPLYPAIPVFFILINIMILILGFAERPIASSIAILTVLVGIPLYYIFKNIKTIK